jgi:hypothetical protein
MQFTELSELNHVVGLMRLAACNSPTFHDRQDSEVDRIYNSSPKMESQLRNSWIDKIDKMTAFKPLASTTNSSTKKSPKGLRKGSSSNISTTGKARDADAMPKPQKSVASSAAMSRRRTSTRADRKSGAASVKAGEKSESGADKKEPDDGFTFEKEEVPPISFHYSSLLDKALKGPAAAAMGARPPLMGADGGAVLHLTIYLPTRDEMKIDVSAGRSMRGEMEPDSFAVASCTTCRRLTKQFRSCCGCIRQILASRHCIMVIPSATSCVCTTRMDTRTRTSLVGCVESGC